MDKNEVLKFLEPKGTRRTVLALRAIGRRNLALNAAALEVAKRLARLEEAACRWVGKDALRELMSPKVRSGLARRAR